MPSLAGNRNPVLCAAASVLALLPDAAMAKPPEAKSLSPLAISRNAEAVVTVHGENLAGVTGVWLDCPLLEAKVLRTEASNATLSVRALPDAELGFHAIHVISPHGM